MIVRKENEFETLVSWITLAEQKVTSIVQEINMTNNPYGNIRFTTIVSTLLALLDSQLLPKEHQLTGIKLIRKIVEVENSELVTPAADWDSDDWVSYARMIEVK